MTDKIQNVINNLIEKLKLQGGGEFKLIVLFGLLGDFDSFEYAINLKNFINNSQDKNLDIFAIAIGSKNGKEKFCNFTGFQKKNLRVVCDNKIHQDLKISKGIDIGLGGWINMLIMLSGINSLKTLQEVLRGYTGDRNSKQIFSDEEKINFLNLIKFSGILFKYSCGDGYLRPFELATFRLKNMIEILQSWNDYIIDTKYLPQRGASFLLNNQDQIIYEYFSKDVLGYSPKMSNPLSFLSEKCK